MKTYLYIAFLMSGIPGMLQSQQILQSHLNLPRIGDELIKQQVEYKDPGRSGENVLWDFSRLNLINDEYTLSYFEAYNGYLAGMEHLTMYYHTLSNDSLLLWGFENQTTRLTNDRPELLLKFPVRYQDRSRCYYHGHGLYSNRLEMDAMGTVETETDAFGMMVLPDKDTLRNVLRVRTVKYIAEELKPMSNDYYFMLDSVKPLISNDSIDFRLATDSILMAVETFRWYARGYRYPVFETVRSWVERRGDTEIEHFNTAFFFPPQDHYYLEDDEANQKIIEMQKQQDKKYNPLEDVKFNAFPNPVSTLLDVEVFLPVEAKIKLQIRSVANKNVYLNENRGKFSKGIHRFQLDVWKLPPGYYLLNIWADNYMLDYTILKQ